MESVHSPSAGDKATAESEVDGRRAIARLGIRPRRWRERGGPGSTARAIAVYWWCFDRGFASWREECDLDGLPPPDPATFLPDDWCAAHQSGQYAYGWWESAPPEGYDGRCPTGPDFSSEEEAIAAAALAFARLPPERQAELLSA